MDDPITRFCAGDKNAFREVVETYQVRIRAMLAFMGIQPADVDDLAQNTFIHVYRNIRTFEAGTDFSAWIKVIARNKARAYFKSKQRELARREKALEFFLLQSDRQSDEPEAQDDIVERLRECITELAGHARDALMKRYAGISLDLISREINRSVDATKMLLLRARIAIRTCLEAKS